MTELTHRSDIFALSDEYVEKEQAAALLASLRSKE